MKSFPPKISVAIATHNEEENIVDCLNSMKGLNQEVVMVDGSSTDKTVELAKQLGAKVMSVENDPMFHNMKQLAIDNCRGDWIILIDADERLTEKLRLEIIKVTSMSDTEIEEYQKNLPSRKLFLRHQHLLENRDGKIGTSNGEYAGFFFPRLNWFLGKFLKRGGVYPDGVIRLFKRGKAYLPCRDVHEQMVVLGKVGWLENHLLHFDSPSFKRYLVRNNRYVNLITSELKQKKTAKNLVNFWLYLIYMPLSWFFLTAIRHKGILDGYQGIIFSFFSALRFPKAYIRYLRNE